MYWVCGVGKYKVMGDFVGTEMKRKGVVEVLDIAVSDYILFCGS